MSAEAVFRQTQRILCEDFIVRLLPNGEYAYARNKAITDGKFEPGSDEEDFLFQTQRWRLQGFGVLIFRMGKLPTTLPSTEFYSPPWGTPETAVELLLDQNRELMSLSQGGIGVYDALIRLTNPAE